MEREIIAGQWTAASLRSDRMMVESPAREWVVRDQEILAAWLRGGEGCSAAVGQPAAIAGLAEALQRAGVPVVRLTEVILGSLDDAPGLAARELELVAMRGQRPDGRDPADVQDRQTEIRQALQAGLQRWLAEMEGADEPLAVRDLELAMAERVDLTGLASLSRPVLVLAPGKLRSETVWLYAAGRNDGEPLPPALTAQVWELTQEPARERTG